MNKVIKPLHIQNPESVFAEENLSHKRREVEDIIARFELVADAHPVHGEVIELLQALKDFRGDTDIDGIFAEMRSLGKSDKQLQLIFTHMEQALARAQQFIKQNLSVQDKKIMLSALLYTNISVHHRMAELKPTDRLVPLWRQSLLQKMLG